MAPTPVALPPALRFLRRLEFPRKLGLLERLFGGSIAPHGVCWVDTAADITWKLDLSNPTHRWIVYGKYEGHAFLNWASRFLPSDGIVVDSGANIGQMLLYLAQRVPRGKVLAFEPHAEAAAWLRECLQEHRRLPVDLVQSALGEREGRLFLEQKGGTELHGAWNRISENSGVPVSVTTLDAALEEKAVARVDLWKLDVEGYELHALRGAARLLAQQKVRAIYVELGFGNGPAIVDYLSGFDYACRLFTRSGSLYAPTTLPDHTNGLFLPRS